MPNKLLVKKNVLVKTKFGPKIIFGQEMFGSNKNIGSKKNFWSRQFCVPKKFGSKNIGLEGANFGIQFIDLYKAYIKNLGKIEILNKQFSRQIFL